MGLAVDRDLPLLHRLEERSLRLGTGAIDLVGEHDLREHGSWPELEVVDLLVECAHAGHVGRQQVRCELDAAEGAVKRSGEGLRQHRLADAGHVLDEQVTFAEQGHEAEANLVLFIDDRPAHIGKHRIGHSSDNFGLHQTPPPSLPAMIGIIDLGVGHAGLYVRMARLVPPRVTDRMRTA